VSARTKGLKLCRGKGQQIRFYKESSCCATKGYENLETTREASLFRKEKKRRRGESGVAFKTNRGKKERRLVVVSLDQR